MKFTGENDVFFGLKISRVPLRNARKSFREVCGTVSGPEKFSGLLRSARQGRVVRKPVNTNPGLKVNRDNNFSCIKMFSTAYVLCSLRLLKLKTEGQTTCTENLTEKLKKK